MTGKPGYQADPEHPLASVLDGLDKPDVSASREDKHAYASALSRRLAVLIGRTLRPTYPAVLPTEDDIGHESATGSSEGKKRLDVKVWDDTLGLLLIVSIKTYSFRDWSSKKQQAGRYTKNVKRNGLELKDEADVMHRRQPYSVMVAVMFVPIDSCDDGKPEAKAAAAGASSFASMVQRLRLRTGRSVNPDEKRFERYDLAEKFYLALYEPDGENRGWVRFFDVDQPPPRVGRPNDSLLVSLDELAVEIKALVDARNSLGTEWAALKEETESDEDDGDE